MRLNFETYEAVDGTLATAYLMRRHLAKGENRLPFFKAVDIFWVNVGVLIASFRVAFDKRYNKAQ